MTAAEIAFYSSEFDIFAHRPTETSVLGTIEAGYKPIVSIYQKDQEFILPDDNDTYIDQVIKRYVRVN